VPGGAPGAGALGAGALGAGALPIAWAAGAVALHALLAVATLAGIPWTRATILGAALLAALAWRIAARSGRGAPAAPPWRVGAADCAAAGIALLVVALAAAGRITQPDFFYHWGLKARRFLEFAGADYYFLAGPSAWRLHPDYPLLVPELLLLPGSLIGTFVEGAALAAAAVPILLLPLALARALAAAGVEGAARGTAVAASTAGLAAFVVAYGLAGSADPWMALALLLALPPLLARAPTPASGWELGIAAALAASAKIEGVPAAALLIAVEAARRLGRAGARATVAHLARVAGPTLVVVVPWFALARAYRLFLDTNAGALDWERAPVIARAALASALEPAWALLPLALLALPVLARRAPTRAPAIVLLLQLLFYFGVYFTGPVDTRFYVLSTLPRLLFHLIPATLALLAIATLGPGAERRTSAPVPAPRESAA
jgi:hypothetical protein